jgi:hypothetical protein
MSFLTKVCKPLSPDDRLDEYNAHFHKFDEEHLRRAALGVIAKRRMLAEIRNREVAKRMAVPGVEVIVKRPKLSMVR